MNIMNPLDGTSDTGLMCSGQMEFLPTETAYEELTGHRGTWAQVASPPGLGGVRIATWGSDPSSGPTAFAGGGRKTRTYGGMWNHLQGHAYRSAVPC